MKKEYYQELNYQPESRYFPIPPSEQGIPTVTASYWVQAVDGEAILEGVHFDRTGETLYFVECKRNRVMKVDMATKQVSVFYDLEAANPGIGVSAVKIHKDGRIFVACCNKDYKTGGEVIYINPDGSGHTSVLKGYVVNDMVFDPNGGFYITHFVGIVGNEIGGVYHISPDYSKVTPILEHLAGPNGIGLSTDGRLLWVSETNRSQILRIELEEDGVTVPPFGVSVVYHTIASLGPDSIYVDDDDNVYCAMMGQARVMVFNQHGWPIGQVLMPEREKGLNPRSSHPTVRPGTRELYICTSGDSGEGAWIVRAGSFAKANTHAYHLA